MINRSSPFHDGFGSAFKKLSTDLKSANSTKTDPCGLYKHLTLIRKGRLRRALNAFVPSTRLMRTALVLPYSLKYFSSSSWIPRGSSSPNPFWVKSDKCHNPGRNYTHCINAPLKLTLGFLDFRCP